MFLRISFGKYNRSDIGAAGWLRSGLSFLTGHGYAASSERIRILAAPEVIDFIDLQAGIDFTGIRVRISCHTGLW